MRFGNATGVFDLTAMCKHRITGPDAEAYLNRLVPRDVRKIKPGRVGYTVWCNDEGQVIDDGTIFHMREGDYRLCSQERQLDWLLTSALGFDVTIVEGYPRGDRAGGSRPDLLRDTEAYGRGWNRRSQALRSSACPL